MILADLDHSKEADAPCGHRIGDSALRAVRQVLFEGMTEVDRLGRYEGEECVLLLSETNLVRTLEENERLWKAVGQLRIPMTPTHSGSVPFWARRIAQRTRTPWMTLSGERTTASTRRHGPAATPLSATG